MKLAWPAAPSRTGVGRAPIVRAWAAPLVACCWIFLGPASAQADTITLTNGRVIEADRAWYEGNELKYQKQDAVFGIPRQLVAKVERAAPTPGSPELIRARQELAQNNPAEAVRILKEAVARGDRGGATVRLLVEAHLAAGDPASARDVAEQQLKLDPKDAEMHALRGDALTALGDRVGAEVAYRRSLQIQPDVEVSRKLSELAPAPATPTVNGAQLRLRYDGSVNEPLGAAVLAALGDAFAEYGRRLGAQPSQPVTVVLQTGTEFQGDTRNPEWAAGINDGTIRAPVGGLDRVTPGLLKVLRHELAHSFVSAATGGNCPTWLHEGVAQWLEGGDPGRDDKTVAAALRSGQHVSLAALNGGFRHMSTAEATIAYAESLSAVAHILRTRGEPGITRILASLGDGLPAEEAFVVALAESYSEFQRSWTSAVLAANPARPK